MKHKTLLDWYKDKLTKEGNNVSNFTDQQLTYKLGKSMEGEYGPQKVKEYPEFNKQYKSVVNAYKAEDLGRDGFFGGVKEIGAGIGQGIDETQGMLYGGAGFLAKKVGLDGASDYLMGKSMENMEESQVDAPTIQSYSEVNSFGEGLRYLSGGIGRVIPSGATMVGTGGIGGLIGKQVLKKAVVGPALKKYAKRLTQKGIDADDYTKSIGKRYAELAPEMQDIAKGYASGLSMLGTTTAASGTMGIGEVYSSLYPYTQLDKQDSDYVTPESAEALSWKFGLAIGALDTILPSMVGPKLLKKFFPGKNPTASDIQLADNFVKRALLKQTAKGIVLEGGTEATQEYLNVVAEKFAHNEDSPFDLTEFSDQEIDTLIDGGILGMIGGATFSGATELAAGAKSQLADRKAEKAKKEELQNNLDAIIKAEAEKSEATEEAVSQIAPTKAFDIGQKVITKEGDVVEFKGLSGEDAVIAVKPNPDLDRLVEKRVPLKSLSKYEEVESTKEEESQSPDTELQEIRDLIIERDYLKEELKAGASPEATMRIAEINKKLDDYSASEKTSVDNFREEKIAEQEGTKEGQRRKKKSEYQEEQDAKDALREREVNGIPLPEAQAYLMLNELLADPTISSDDLTKGKLKDKEGFTEAFQEWSVMFYGSRNPGYKEFITAFKNGAEKFHGAGFKTAGDLAADQKKVEDAEKVAGADRLKKIADEAKVKIAQRKDDVKVADRIRKIQGGKSEIFKVRSSDANYSHTYPELELANAKSKDIGKPLDIQPISKKDWEKEFSVKNLSDKNKNPGTGKIAGQNSYEDYVKDIDILKSTLEANTSDKAKVDEILNRPNQTTKKTPSSPKVPNSPKPQKEVVEEIDGSTLDAIPAIENGKYVFKVGASNSILNVNPDVVSRGGKFKKERSDYNQLSDLVLSLEKPFDVSEVITPSNQKIKISFDGVSVNYTINSEDNYQVVASKSKNEAKYIYGKEDDEFSSLEDPSSQTHVRVKDSQNFEGRAVNAEEIILGTETTKKYQLRSDLPNGTDTGSVHLVAIKHEKTGSIFVRSVKREKTEIKISHLKRKTRQSKVQVNLGEEASSMSVSELPEGFSVYGSVWLSATKGSLRQDFTSSNEYETWLSSFKVLPIRQTGQTAKKKIADIEEKASSEEYQNEVIQAYKDENWDVVDEAEPYFEFKTIEEEAPNEALRVQKLESIKAGLDQASKELDAAQNKLVEPLTGDTALSVEYSEYEGQVEELIKEIDEDILSEEGDIWSKIKDAEATIDSQIKEANKAYDDATSGPGYTQFVSMPRKDENGKEIDVITLDDWIKDENTKDADFPFSIELSMSLFGYPTADPASEIKIGDAVQKLPMEDRKSIADAVGRDAKIQDRDKKTYVPKPTKNAKLALKNNFKHITDENVNKFATLLYKATFDRYQINNDTERQVDGAREVRGKDGEMESVYNILGLEVSTPAERFSDQVWLEELYKDASIVNIKKFSKDPVRSWITPEQMNILVEYSKNNLQGFSEIQDITDTLNLSAHKNSESAKPGELKKPEAIVYNLLFSERNGGNYQWGGVEEPGVVYQFLQWMGSQNPLSDTEKASEVVFTKASDSQAWIALAERFSNEGVGGIKENSINVLQQVYKESDSSRYPSAAEATLHAFNLARTQDPDKAFNHLAEFTDAISKIAIGDDRLGSQILNAIGESTKVSDIANAIDLINDADVFDTTRLSQSAELDKVKSLIEGFAKDAIKQLGKRYNAYALFNRVINAKKLKPSVYGIPQTKVEKDAVNAEEPTSGISATGMPVIQNMSDLYLGDSTSYSIADNADKHNATQSLKRRTNFEQNVILSEDQQARNKRAIDNIIGDNIFAPVVLEKMKRYVENYGISEESNEFLYKYLEVVEKALAGRDAPLSVIPVDNITSEPNRITRGNRVDDSVFINRQFHAGKDDFIAEELPFNFVEDKTTNVLMSVLMHEVWHGSMEVQLRAHEDKARLGQRSEIQETYDLIKDVISEIKKTKGANKFTFLFSNDQVAVSETLNYAWTRKDFAKFLSETKITNDGIKRRIDKNGKNLISTLMDALYAAYVKLLNTFGINTKGSALGSILELSRQLEAQNQALLPGVSIPPNVADRKTYDFLMNDSLDNSRISVEVLQNYKKDVAEEYLEAFEDIDDTSYVTAVITGDFDGLTPDELGYVKDSLKTLNPRMRNLLRALQRDDYLGFDTPFEAIDAILTEDTESLFSNFDMSPSLKSGITKYMDSLLGTKTRPNKSLSFPIGQDLQMAGEKLSASEGKPLIVSDFIPVVTEYDFSPTAGVHDKSFLDISTIDESILKKLRESWVRNPSMYLSDVTAPINAFHENITKVLENDLDFYNQFKSRGTEDGDIKAQKMLNNIIERIGDIEMGKGLGPAAQEALNSLNHQGVIDGIIDQLQKIKDGSTTDLQMTNLGQEEIKGDDDLYIFEGLYPKEQQGIIDVSNNEAMGVIMDNLSRSKDKIDAKIASLFKDGIIKVGTTIKWDFDTRWAAYGPSDNVIYLNPDQFTGERSALKNRLSQRAFLHEVGHALTLTGLDLSNAAGGSSSGPNAEFLQDTYRDIMKHVKREEMDVHYGLSSYEEFLTEAITNREFQEYLATIPASDPTMFANAWNELLNLIGKVLGIDMDSTMLGQVLTAFGESFKFFSYDKYFNLRPDNQLEAFDIYSPDSLGKDPQILETPLFEKPEIVTKLPLRDLTRLAARDINWGGNDRQMDRQLANLINENTSASYMDALNEIDSLHAIFNATPNKKREAFKQEARDKGIKNYYGRGQAMEDSLEGDRNPNENQTLDRDANEIAGAKMQAAATNELLASISESMEDIRLILNEPTLSVEDVIKKFFKGSRSPIKQVKQLVKNYNEAMADVTIESIKPNEGMAQHSRTIALRKVELFLKQSREALSANLDQLDPKQDKSLVSEITNLEKDLIVDPSVIFDRSNHGDNLSKQIKHEVQTARQEAADTVIDDIDTGNSSLIQAFSEITESKTLSEDFIDALKKRKGSYSSQYLSDLIFKVSKVDDIQALTPKDIYNIIKVDGKLSDNEYIIISSAINRNKDSVHQARLSSSDNYQGKRTTLKKLEDLSKSTIDQLKVIKGKNPERSLLTGTKQERQILESFINKRISYLEKLELVKDIEKSNQVYRSLNKYLKVNSSRLQTYLHHSPVTNIVDGMTFPVMKKVEGEYQLSSIKVRLSNKMLPEDIKEFVEARQNNRDYLADPMNEKIQATADFEYIRNATAAADALTLQPQHKEAQGKLNGWWLKSAQKMFGETGRLGKEIAQMELKFDIAYRTYVSQAKAHGRRWNRKLLNASEAWGYKNERLFLDQIYDKVLKWNEDQPQLNDKASFDSGTYEKALSLVPDKDAMTANARQALRELLEQSRVTSDFMMGISKTLGNKVTEEGVKVSSKFSTDEDYEMQDLERDPIRRGYQTSGRKIRSEYVLGIVNELSGKGWADEESWSDVVDAIKDKNATEEAKVRAMDAYLEIGVDEYVLDKFIKPYLLDTSVRGLLTLPDGGKIPRNYLVSAWEKSEGEGNKRFLSFIDTLYESVPHKADSGDYIGFKYGVIKAFNKRYQRLFEMVSDVGGANDNKAYALAHRLMDSRSMETIIPVEFLQYETYTEVDTQIHIAQIIGNSVYGRNADRLTSLRTQLEGELKDKRARLINIADILGMTPPNSAPFKIKRGLRQRAAQLVEGMQDIPGENGSEKLKNLEASTRQLANFHKANKHLQAHLEGDVGPFKDHKLLLELLGTNAFLILNQPKSGLTNLLSLADQPLVYRGFNKFSRKALSSSLANVFGNIFGPMIEKTGLQLQVTSDYAQWLNDVYFKSSEHEVGFSDYKLNLGGGASKKASKLEIFKLDGLRQLKDSLQYTPVKKDQKYAPFALRTMFLNPFTYLGNLANHSLGVGAVNAVDMLVKQAADFIEQTGQRTGQPLPQTFQVTAENLGLEEKSFTGEVILGSESMFNYVNNAIEQRGLGTISDLAHQYIERKAKGKTLALTKDQAIAISTIALHDVAMEGGFTSRSAFWYTNEWAKYAAPLLSWSFSKVNQVNESFRNEQTSEIELQASIRALSVMALWLAPVGMAFTFGMDEYDEEILGKASSLRPISKASMIPIFGPFMADGDAKSNALAMTERLARAGNIGGIAGDFFASIVSSVDPYTTQRGFSLDTRILGMATILNMRDALTNAHHSGSFDYNLVVRPLLYSMGGNSLLQTTQAASNLLGFDILERRISDMIGNRNKVRAALSTLEIERRPAGPGGGIRATPFSIHIRKMEQAAYADDNKLFEDAYRRAIEESIERGDEDPEAKVLQSYKRRTLRSGISRYTLDDNEWGKVLNVFTPEQSRSLERAQMMHEKYEDILKEMDDLNLVIPSQNFAPIDYEKLIKQSLSF